MASCPSLSDLDVWPLRDLFNDPVTWKSDGVESSSMQDVWTSPTAWYSVGRPLSWPHDTGHCAAGCYCHWVYPDIGFWSYIDFEVTVLSLSCAAVLSILFYRSVCVFRDYNVAMPSIPTQHMWSGLSCMWLVLCIGSYTLNYKYVQPGQTTRYYLNGKNTSWRRMNYRNSQPVRHAFFPWKMWPKFALRLTHWG